MRSFDKANKDSIMNNMIVDLDVLDKLVKEGVRDKNESLIIELYWHSLLYGKTKLIE